MPQHTLEARRQKLEQLARRSGRSQEQILRLLNEFDRREAERLRAEHQAEIQRLAQQELSAQRGSTHRTAQGALVAGGLHLANSATLGHLPGLVGMVSPESGQRIGNALEVSRATNPIASGLGDLGGFFVGPAGAAAKIAGGSAAAATGTTALTRAALGRSFGAKFAANFVQNLTSGAGAITATELLRHQEESLGLSQRLAKAAEIVTSPTNLVLSAVGAGISARMSHAINREVATLAQAFERRTGVKVTNDVLTDDAGLQSFMDTAARTPGLERAVQRVRQRLFEAMRKSVSRIARGHGISGTPGRAGREAVRMGAARAAGSLRGEEGLVTQTRRLGEREALAEEGMNRLTREDTLFMRRGLQAIIRSNKGGESRAGFMPIIKDFFRFSKEKGPDGRLRLRDMNIYELENLRKQAARLAFLKGPVDPLDPRLSERSRLEAGQFYHLIQKVMERVAPKYRASLTAAEQLRRMEEALPPVKLPELQDAAAEAFWAAKGLLGKAGQPGKVETAEQLLEPQRWQQLKGWYFHKLIEATVNDKTSFISGPKLDRLTRNSKSMFNSQVLDRVLPGVRRELLNLAKLTETMNKGITHHEGSDTARRVTRQIPGLVEGGGLVAGSTLAYLLSNPYLLVTGILGPAGVKAAIVAYRRSMITGVVAQATRRLSLEGPRGLSRLPVAVGSQPGRQTADQVLSVFGTAGQSILDSLGRVPAAGGNQQ